MLAGAALGNWARLHWEGKVDEVLLMESALAGSLPHLRASGIETAVRNALRGKSSPRFVSLDCVGSLPQAFDIVRKHLRVSRASRTLISGVNDLGVMGALAAFEEAGRRTDCAGIGLGAVPEARTELAKPGSCLIGSVAFFPEQYGSDLVSLAMSILLGRHSPPAVYAAHHLITAKNVRRFYPDYATAGLAHADTRSTPPDHR